VSGLSIDVRAPHGRDLAPGLVADLRDAGAGVRSLEVSGPTLDDVFLELTGRSLRETSSAPALEEVAA
jgi:ABC-2 type transport system ATP-binding protein